ncbi:unnamed protein product [Toxocara canis]|uniref:Uncharacterized protein n=1 Tax=Toxocara canis TaxID=6265 RepID=A0A183VDR1_TOXCA|nr:unnamed protein product [Toxocara canis]
MCTAPSASSVPTEQGGGISPFRNISAWRHMANTVLNANNAYALRPLTEAAEKRISCAVDLHSFLNTPFRRNSFLAVLIDKVCLIYILDPLY